MAGIEAIIPKNVASTEIEARILKTIPCASLHSHVMTSRCAQPNQVIEPAHPATADHRHAEMRFSIIFEPTRWPWSWVKESPKPRLQMIGVPECVQVEPGQGFPDGLPRHSPMCALENCGESS
jgi:hypothetical protein